MQDPRTAPAAPELPSVAGPRRALATVLASDPAIAVAGDRLPAAIPATRWSLPRFGAATTSLVALLAARRFLPEPRTARDRVGTNYGYRDYRLLA
jgi:hypothetical protein